VPSVSPSKNPALVAAGKAGMRARWGRRRHLRLDELSEPVRSAIEALIAAEENAREREAAKAGTS